MADAFFISKNMDAGSVPVLDAAYPMDVNMLASISASNVATTTLRVNVTGGSTVTGYTWTMDGATIAGATESSYVYTAPLPSAMSGNTVTHTFQCTVTNSIGSTPSRQATVTIKKRIAVLNSSATTVQNSGVVDENNEGTHWTVRCLYGTGGTKVINFSHMPNETVDICVIGGGGGGGMGNSYSGGGGGAGGYVQNYLGVTMKAGTNYTVHIGEGGAYSQSCYTGPGDSDPGYKGNSGGTSYIISTNYSASGGSGGYSGRMYNSGKKMSSSYYGGQFATSGQGYGGCGGGNSADGNNVSGNMDGTGGGIGAYPFGEGYAGFSRRCGAGGAGGGGTSSGKYVATIASGGDFSFPSAGANYNTLAVAPPESAYGAGGSGGSHNGNYKYGASGVSGCVIIRDHRE